MCNWFLIEIYVRGLINLVYLRLYYLRVCSKTARADGLTTAAEKKRRNLLVEGCVVCVVCEVKSHVKHVRRGWELMLTKMCGVSRGFCSIHSEGSHSIWWIRTGVVENVRRRSVLCGVFFLGWDGDISSGFISFSACFVAEGGGGGTTITQKLSALTAKPRNRSQRPARPHPQRLATRISDPAIGQEQKQKHNNR